MSALTLYSTTLILQWNIMLAVGLALYYFTSSFFRFIKCEISFKHWLRFAQGIFLLSFFIPIAFHHLPDPFYVGHDTSLAFQGEVDSMPGQMNHLREVKSSSPIRLAIQGGVVALSEKKQAFGATFSLSNVFLFFFTAGFLAMLFRLCFQYAFLRKQVFSSLLIKRRGRVFILVSHLTSIPFSAWVGGKSVVVIPENLLSKEKELKMAVLHELQHHRQKDAIWALGIEFFFPLFYFNPAIYAWKRFINELQELACDESLLTRKAVSVSEYGAGLLTIAQFAISKPNGFAVNFMASKQSHFSDSGRLLKMRIEMMMRKVNPQPFSRGVFALASLVCVTLVLVNAYGTELAVRRGQRMVPAASIAHVDAEIQKIAEEELSETLKLENADEGFVFVSEPKTGRVLAVANQSNDPAPKLKQWALSFSLQPASVMKGIIAAKARDLGLIHFDENIDCGKGELKVGNDLIRDWRPFNSLKVSQVLAYSSNIGAFQIAKRLGADKLISGLKDFGFGENGIAAGYPNANDGHLPNLNHDDPTRSLISLAIGESSNAPFQVTPLEILASYGAIANGGELMRPIPADADFAEVKVVRKVIRAGTASETRRALADVVNFGTGKLAKSSMVETAGKTSSMIDKDYAAAGFAGFAPVTEPEIVVYAVVIDRKKSNFSQVNGGRQAAPLFRRVIERSLPILRKRQSI